MLITARDNSKIKELKKWLTSSYSKEKGLFLIEGENLIEEAIKTNHLKELYVLNGYKCKYEFPYTNLSPEVMKSISSLKSVPRLLGVSTYIDKKELGNKIVILDGVQDPGNAGTIIRNAVAFDVDTIVFSNDSVNPYNEKVLRSTGGMIYNINIIICDIDKIINDIKKNDIKIIGTSLSKSKSLNDVNMINKYAIIFGNEGQGVKKSILSKCDEIVRIDMNSKCESLNVGVSTGIILYHMYKG